MLAVYTDDAVIADALAFETALAHAQLDAGLVTEEQAKAIITACASLVFDPATLASEVALAGTLAIPLVKRLRETLPAELAALAHRGATSQDVADTVMVLQARRALTLLEIDVARILKGLSGLATRHAQTPAIGRTLLQDAMPIGFGLRIAHWHAAIAEAMSRLEKDVEDHARVQLGGAAGTRADLGGAGALVATRMAGLLGLADGAPWHGRRMGVSAIGTSLAMLIGALGKMARDISLLSQNAIGEAREPAIAGRGGSSAMAHKCNPTGCQIALAAAHRAPGLAATLLSGLPQEEERGLGGWQAEAPALADLFMIAAGSADAMAIVAEGLIVDEAAIARNLHSATTSVDIGESVKLTQDLLQMNGND
ncbi:lyase family protein [Sphingobium yanoikuyae]|jgi:3-carboxy-cis,cis-muconate cycloisomerase|uniref:lyase family protein n=1 Tax=Sphingobium yanoikuyae TaxID=13690 RepID=UPI003B921677